MTLAEEKRERSYYCSRLTEEFQRVRTIRDITPPAWHEELNIYPTFFALGHLDGMICTGELSDVQMAAADAFRMALMAEQRATKKILECSGATT